MGLDITGVGSIFDFGSKVIDKLWPDPATRDKAKLELLKAQQEGAFKELEAQIQFAQQQTDVNKVEAANHSLFVSGWRPAVGWVCVSAMFCNFIAVPLLGWGATVFDPSIPVPPRLDTTELFQLLLGMLGLGGLRTYERLNGVAREQPPKK